MPCQGPSDSECAQERYNEELQVMLSYLLDKINSDNNLIIPKLIADFLKLSGYSLMANFPTVHEYICDRISELNKIQLDRIVYNARDKNSRDLANWWEEHSNHDLNNAEAELARLDKCIIHNAESTKSLKEKRLETISEIQTIKARKA